MKTTTILGQPSWRFASDRVEAALSKKGGNLAPVRFRVGHRIIEPFSIAPWAQEPPDRKALPILQVLRGDFFCAPFGGNETPYRNEKHPPHGESANSEWSFQSLKESEEAVCLKVALKTKIRRGQIEKSIHLRRGHSVLYCRHILSGMSGPMNLGHHAMLKFPDAPESGLISTSRIRFGQVYPGRLEDPANGGYNSLKPGATFRHLDRVRTIFGGTTDVSRYPARRGFEDLLMVVHAAREDFAWTAVAFPEEGYVWYSLKDPRVLQSTVFWLSNGGRHYPPWNGRHVNVMGLEDVTSYFHTGLAESARNNSLNRKGFQTAIILRKNKPLTVNCIMGVAAIPRRFQKVKAIRPEKNFISILSSSGQTVRTPVHLEFLYSDETQ